VPTHPVLEIRGTATALVHIPLTKLADLARHEVIAPFHCVAGWSTVELRWEGVSFMTFYEHVIGPLLEPDAAITHVAFRGLDGFHSVLTVEDALDQDVLLAERLDGEPLHPDHGAPLRLVSPQQYGYMSTKHLSRIDLLTAPPANLHRSLGDRIMESHPRARVRNEERHGSLPGRLVRPFYRSLKPILLVLCARGDSTQNRR
jgi:DMSO/TMAO reductase YedYZ molybdopterin-dependent catalytic subunit